jgi:hypothetical protein
LTEPQLGVAAHAEKAEAELEKVRAELAEARKEKP